MSAVLFTCLLLAQPAAEGHAVGVEIAPHDVQNSVLRERLFDWVTPKGQDGAGTQLLACVAVLSAAWLALFVRNFIVGMGQKRDGRGRWSRLTWVSAALALLQSAPLAMFLAILLLVPPGVDLIVAALAAPVAIVVAAWDLMGWMAPPFRWPGTRQCSPLLEDEAVLDRVREMAGAMGLAPPTVRVLYSDSSYQGIQAYAGGLAAPAVEVSDGTLFRLSPGERDLVLAHELAHFANRSMWYDACVTAVCGVAAIVISGFFGLFIGCLFALALFLGLRTVVSRYCELDCDRRAAELLGFRPAAALERRLRAESWAGIPAWVEFLFSTIATHPSSDERADVLHRTAPDDDKPDVRWSPRKVHWRRVGARVAAGLWLAGIAVPLMLCGWSATSWLAAPLLLGVSLVAWGIGELPSIRWHEQFRTLANASYFLFLSAAGLYFCFLAFAVTWFFGTHSSWEFVVLVFDSFRESTAVKLGAALVVGSSIWWLIDAVRERPDDEDKLCRDMTIAICSRDFANAVELAEAKPDLLAESSMLRGKLAMVRAYQGDISQAIDELEQVVVDEPYDTENWLHLSTLHLVEGNDERALYLALEAADRWPQGAGPFLNAARALGNLREPEAASYLEKALRAEPYYIGEVRTLEVWVALRDGDLQRARERLSEAEHYLPGSTENRFLEAAIAVEEAQTTGDPTDGQAAAQAIARAGESVRNNPLALLDEPMAELAERFAGAVN